MICSCLFSYAILPPESGKLELIDVILDDLNEPVVYHSHAEEEKEGG